MSVTTPMTFKDTTLKFSDNIDGQNGSENPLNPANLLSMV